MSNRSDGTRRSLVGLGLLAVASVGCGSRREDPDRDAPPTSAAGGVPAAMSAPVAGSAAPSASAAAEERVPTLGLERFAPGKNEPRRVTRVEGALLTIEGAKVGRVVGETIEPVGKIPYDEAMPGPFGPPLVRTVSGRWPDKVDVIYTTSQPRAASPSYMALTGKGKPHTMSPGGGVGDIMGIATVGETTLLAVKDSQATHYLSIAHGPKLPGYKLQTPAQAKCKPGEVPKQDLVEFHAGGARRVGVKVTSRAQGEALIAHLAATRKSEHPKMVCFDPTSPREISLAK